MEGKKGKAGVKVNSWAHPFPEFCWSGGIWIPKVLSSAAPWAVLLHPGGTFPLDVPGWLCLGLHQPLSSFPWAGISPGGNQGSLRVKFLPLENGRGEPSVTRAEHLWCQLGRSISRMRWFWSRERCWMWVQWPDTAPSRIPAGRSVSNSRCLPTAPSGTSCTPGNGPSRRSQRRQ